MCVPGAQSSGFLRESEVEPLIGAVPAGLEHFSFQNFEMRAHTLFRQVLAEAPHHYGG